MGRGIVVAVALVVLAVGLILWPWPAPEPAAPAVVDVQVDGPDGPFWNGTVTASPATAMEALLAAGRDGGFTVDTAGPVGNRYVASVNGSGEGWCFQVDGEDGDRSADQVPLEDGSVVRWYWTDGQCDRF